MAAATDYSAAAPSTVSAAPGPRNSSYTCSPLKCSRSSSRLLRPSPRALHDTLHAAGGVKAVHLVAGLIDVIVFVEGADQVGLMEAIGRLRTVKGVASADTRIVLPM